MSGSRNRLYHGNNMNHWKFSDFVIDHNYFYFFQPNPNPNPTHLTKQDFPSPNDQFYQRIWYVEHYSGHGHVVWIQKFRKSEISLDTGKKIGDSGRSPIRHSDTVITSAMAFFKCASSVSQCWYINEWWRSFQKSMNRVTHAICKVFVR